MVKDFEASILFNIPEPDYGKGSDIEVEGEGSRRSSRLEELMTRLEWLSRNEAKFAPRIIIYWDMGMWYIFTRFTVGTAEKVYEILGEPLDPESKDQTSE